MIIVRGVNVYPLAVHDVLCTLIPEVVGEFQLILQSAPPIDYDPLLRVEAEAESADLADRVQQLMTRRLNFRPTVELVPVGSLPKDPGKARRLIRAYAL
jgi:phenylacetate-CoA ligase